MPRDRLRSDGYALRVSVSAGASAVVLGSGGLAREMRQLLGQVDDGITFVGFVIENGQSEPDAPGIVVAGDDTWLSQQTGGPHPPVVVLGSGFPATRLSMLRKVRSVRLKTLSLVHPSAVVDRDEVALGQGVVICAGVVTTCDVVIGDGALLNWNVTVGHDARIGCCSVINPGAHISGSVEIGDGVLIGAGAVVLQGVRVGDAATVGAGAVVTSNVPSGETVVGVPARRRNS